jgi:molybdopterin/thiamine biosynthesis adenylyltransferase
LRASRVTVVGVGGTGGVAALALAAAGVGQLHCVDPDVVDLSNLGRQVVYTEDDTGRPKVGGAVARLRRLNADIAVSGEDTCRLGG